jgi:heme/copper-type cytochrome/quinol oxidase subunit 2
MTIPRRRVGFLLLSAGVYIVARSFLTITAGQEQAPDRHELSLVGKDYRWTPSRIELTQDDLIRLTIRSEDVAYSFAVDEYRIVRRVPPGGMTTLEFRADRPGTFRFYSNLTNDRAHADMQGQLIVRPR